MAFKHELKYAFISLIVRKFCPSPKNFVPPLLSRIQSKMVFGV